MLPEIKREWIKALRSGEFDKGEYALHRISDNTYCCLGVLCEIHHRNHPQFKWEPNENTDIYLEHEATLPGEVMEWAGIKDDEENNVVVEKYYRNE